MRASWAAAATVAAALLLACMPLLVLVDAFEDTLDRMPPTAWLIAPPAAALLAGGVAGWLSRPRWLAAACLLLAVAGLVVTLRATSEPCPEFCEGMPPQGYALLFGALAVWPWQFLGILAGSAANHHAPKPPRAARRRD